MKGARGFTLLEVLVAVAILGLGVTAILSAQAGVFAQAAYARDISVATGLLRCKMTELEEHLLRDGFQLTDENGAGPCCEGDEVPNMRCAWRVEAPVFPEAKFGDLDLGGALNFGSPSTAGSASPLAGALGLLSGGSSSPLGGASSVADIAKTLADSNFQAATAASALFSPSTPAPSASSALATSTDVTPPVGDLTSLITSMVMPDDLPWPQANHGSERATRHNNADVPGGN